MIVISSNLKPHKHHYSVQRKTAFKHFLPDLVALSLDQPVLIAPYSVATSTSVYNWLSCCKVGLAARIEAHAAILCCAVLCYAVLCCAALRCAVLCCAVLCCRGKLQKANVTREPMMGSTFQASSELISS